MRRAVAMATIQGSATITGATAPEVTATPPVLLKPASSAGRSSKKRINDWFVHAPQTLRALVRADELWLVVLAAFVGIAAGLCVTGMTGIAQLMHCTLACRW